MMDRENILNKTGDVFSVPEHTAFPHVLFEKLA
jgi:hypothetical protein